MKPARQQPQQASSQNEHNLKQDETCKAKPSQASLQLKNNQTRQ
jgi:hypothetical protein